MEDNQNQRQVSGNKTLSEKNMKTPLQKLIDWMENEVLNNTQYKDSPRLREGIMITKVKAESLIPEERVMIIDAFNNGRFRDKLGENYFNETFNDNDPKA